MSEDFDFHEYLGVSVRNSDFEAANKRLMTELAGILVRDKSDFVAMLNEAGITADVSMSNVDLINLFIDNIGSNKKLILGASLLTNIHNKKMGFDGDSEIDNLSIKSSFCVMKSCFTDDYMNLEGEEEFSNLIPIGALARAAKTFIDKRKEKGAGASKEQMQQQAKQQMMMAAKLRKEQELAKKKRTRNTWLIVGGSVVGLGLIGLLIYKLRKK